MDLIERYLQSVKFWLPKEQKDDIIAELSEDIHARIEEQQATLGRALTESEIETLLKQRGRPFVVANRFLPQRSLIGPLLFPLYLFILKIGALCYAVAFVVVLELGWQSASRVLLTALVEAAILTGIFAILERWQSKSNFIENWSPRKLRAVRNPNLISRTGSAIELALYLVVQVWWVGNMSSRVISIGPSLQITFSTLWPWIFWGYLVVDLAIIALDCLNLMRPYWTGTRATIRLIVDFASAALFCWLMQANILRGITATGLSSQRAIEITNSINLWTGKMFPAAVIVGLIIAACGVYRIVRLRTRNARLQMQAVA